MSTPEEERYNRLLERHAKLHQAAAGAVLMLESLGGMLPGTKEIVDMTLDMLKKALNDGE